MYVDVGLQGLQPKRGARLLLVSYHHQRCEQRYQRYATCF